MDKWDYIRKLSNMSNIYGDLLLDLMFVYDKSNLQQVTVEECIEYYNAFLDKKEKEELKPITRGARYGYIRCENGIW